MLVARRAEDMNRALEAGLVQMAGVEEGSREELLRRVACAEEGAVVMKVRGWRVMWPARERYLSNTDSPFLSLPHPLKLKSLSKGCYPARRTSSPVTLGLLSGSSANSLIRRPSRLPNKLAMMQKEVSGRHEMSMF